MPRAARLGKTGIDTALQRIGSIGTIFFSSSMTPFVPVVRGSKSLTILENSSRPETPLLSLACRLGRLAGVCPAERAVISPAMTHHAAMWTAAMKYRHE